MDSTPRVKNTINEHNIKIFGVIKIKDEESQNRKKNV
jgi:hypothetical protein